MTKLSNQQLQIINGGSDLAYWLCLGYFGAMGAAIGVGAGPVVGFAVGMYGSVICDQIDRS